MKVLRLKCIRAQLAKGSATAKTSSTTIIPRELLHITEGKSTGFKPSLCWEIGAHSRLHMFSANYWVVTVCIIERKSLIAFTLGPYQILSLFYQARNIHQQWVFAQISDFPYLIINFQLNPFYFPCRHTHSPDLHQNKLPVTSCIPHVFWAPKHMQIIEMLYEQYLTGGLSIKNGQNCSHFPLSQKTRTTRDLVPKSQLPWWCKINPEQTICERNHEFLGVVLTEKRTDNSPDNFSYCICPVSSLIEPTPYLLDYYHVHCYCSPYVYSNDIQKKYLKWLFTFELSLCRLFP